MTKLVKLVNSIHGLGVVKHLKIKPLALRFAKKTFKVPKLGKW